MKAFKASLISLLTISACQSTSNEPVTCAGWMAMHPMEANPENEKIVAMQQPDGGFISLRIKQYNMDFARIEEGQWITNEYTYSQQVAGIPNNLKIRKEGQCISNGLRYNIYTLKLKPGTPAPTQDPVDYGHSL